LPAALSKAGLTDVNRLPGQVAESQSANWDGPRNSRHAPEAGQLESSSRLDGSATWNDKSLGVSVTVAHRSEVKLIRWPADSSSRERCHNEGRPRILVVEAGARPPVCTDQFEDWVRAPISRADLTARVRALEARVGARSKPHVDSSGLVFFNNQSMTVSLMQAELLDELAKQFGAIVSRCLLEHRLARAQMRRPTRNSLDLHIMRLRRNIRPLGLVIDTAWGRGYLLEAS
jgi:hypothetical protein